MAAIITALASLAGGGAAAGAGSLSGIGLSPAQAMKLTMNSLNGLGGNAAPSGLDGMARHLAGSLQSLQAGNPGDLFHDLQNTLSGTSPRQDGVQVLAGDRDRSLDLVNEQCVEPEVSNPAARAMRDPFETDFQGREPDSRKRATAQPEALAADVAPDPEHPLGLGSEEDGSGESAEGEETNQPEPSSEDRATDDPDAEDENPEGQAPGGYRTDEIRTVADVHDVIEDHVRKEVRGGVEKLKKELEEHVEDGGDPVAAAVGATVLDVGAAAADVAVGFTAPLAVGRNTAEKGIKGIALDALDAADFIPEFKGLAAGAGSSGLVKAVLGAAAAKAAKEALKLKRLRASRKFLRAKLGHAGDFVYGFGLSTYGTTRRALAGMEKGPKGTALHVHHTVMQWIFRRGPEELTALGEWVPAMTVSEAEHLGLVHGKGGAALSVEKYLAERGITYKSTFTRAELDRVVTMVRTYYRERGLPELAQAIGEFQLNVMRKV